MNNAKRTHGVFEFVLTFLLLFALTVPHALAEERISSKMTVTPKIQLSNTEKDSLSLAAEQILRQVQVARANIKYSSGAEALKHVQKGLELVKIINNALPEYDLTTTIKSGNATYQDQEKQKQSVIPVYGELDETFAMLPHVKTAKHEGAVNQSPEKSVGEAEVRDTRIFLDIRDANYYLEQAAANLQNNDASQADKSLATLQNNVIHEFGEVEVPLLRARWSLMEAARMVVHNDYQEAKAFLQEAVDQLEIYKSDVGNATVKTTQSMINDIRNVSSGLREQKEASAQKITGIWDKLANSF
jgi:YfdX protein